MDERTRSRRKPQRPTKPYLSEWILTQPSPEKEVLLQVFSGTPERECARKMGMSVEEVHAIAQSAADNGPEVAEDEYAMACFSAKTPEEFTRTTGEGEGIYRFLCLRFHKSPAAPSAEAGQTTLQTSMTSTATPSGGAPGSKTESGLAPNGAAAPGRPATSSARGRSGSSSRSKAKPSPRKRAATAASKTGTTATSPSDQPVEQQPAPRPVDPNDPEVIRRREARKAAREREKARRLRGDW